ncbi:MAG TPA: NAD-binding protein [Patescibacteria group bacterium]|nr:NAD-binding protein [Patescibacteria group bacterium]
MNFIIVGCGRVGAELAYRLFQKGHQVTVIDQVAAAFHNLPTDFRGRTVEGEALASDILRRAGIEKADGLAAVTNSDSLNVVVAHVATTVYHVPQVVVRNYHPRWRPLHEAFGLQVVSSTSWGAQRIEELLYPAFAKCVFSAGNGEVEIYELSVSEAWHGHTLQDLLHAGQCLAVALTRAGKAILPSSEEPLEVGDILYLSSTMEGIETLRERLKAPQGR